MNNGGDPTAIAQDLLRAMLKKKLFLCGCIALALSVGGVLCVLLPKSYRSTTLILVEDQKIPEQFVKATIGGSIEERLMTIQQQVMSRSLLSKVIDEFGLYKDEIERDGMDATIEMMRKHIKVDTIGTNGSRGKAVEAFTISFSHESAAMAQKVTAKLAGQFIEENLKVREQLVTGAAEFLGQELRVANQRLQEMEQAISRFKAAHIGELPQQMEANLRTLDRLAGERNTTMEAVTLLTDRLRDAEKNIADYDSAGMVNANGASTSPRVLDPRMARLRELEQSEAMLASEYKDTYPDLILVRREIETLKRELAGAPVEGRAENDAGPDKRRIYDPYFQELLKQRNEVRNQLAAANEHLRMITQQIKALEAKVEQAPAREQEMLVMLRDYENLQKNYQALLAKQLDAKVVQNLERRQQGEQFRVIDPANYPDRPESPNVMRIMLVSLAAGCGVGVGSIVLMEQAKPVFRRMEEVEVRLGLPVLGVIPHFSLVYGRGRTKRIWPPALRGGGDSSAADSVWAESKAAPDNPSAGGRLWWRRRGIGLWNAQSTKVPDRFNWVSKLFPASLAAEQYRVVASRLSLLASERKASVVVFTSAVKDEGKTTTALNVAYSLARSMGKLTLLIDADFKNPKLHAYTGISNENGLLDLLKGEAISNRIAQCTHRIDSSLLWVMPAGKGEASSTELVDIQRIAPLLVDFRSKFECIMIDAPPVLPLADMNILAQMADVLALVVRAEETPQQVVSRALSVLKPTGQVAVIVNGVAQPSVLSYYYVYSHDKQNMKMIGA